MRAPVAILWDWDNTLVDGWIGIAAALNVVLTEFGMPTWTVDEARERVRGSVRDVFPEMFGAEWRRARALLRSSMAEGHLRHLALMPEAGTLVELGETWPQAVVSNKEGEMLRREVAYLGWNARFRAVVGAGDAKADKPDPAPIWHALGMIGVKPGPEVWYVGDTGSDMPAARAAGCTAVLLGDARHDGGLAALEQRGSAPHLHYSNASALAARLREVAML